MEIELNTRMSLQEKAELDKDVKRLNEQAFIEGRENGRMPRQSLGKTDFLELLMKQLAYQDPLSPMEDKEFIAQMAQFSSLEQMTVMSEGFTKLGSDFTRIVNLLSGSEATAALGRSVEISDGEKTVQGVVRAVTRGLDPQILVNGGYYSWNQVQKVFEE
jgi:flagellar basal-body rod modification protein FlgD